MKAQFLKMAGVKTEKAFYKKFPTEKAFMAKHGKKIKAQVGFMSNMMNYFGGNTTTGGRPVVQSVIPNEGLTSYGTTEGWGGPQVADSTVGGGGGGFNFMQGINPIQGIVKGFRSLKAEKEARKKANQTRQVLGVQETAIASNTNELQQLEISDARQKAVVNPWDNVITGEELFPIYGVGTNVLAKHGKMVKYKHGGKSDVMAPYHNLSQKEYDKVLEAKITSGEISDYKHGGKMKYQRGGEVNYSVDNGNLELLDRSGNVISKPLNDDKFGVSNWMGFIPSIVPGRLGYDSKKAEQRENVYNALKWQPNWKERSTNPHDYLNSTTSSVYDESLRMQYEDRAKTKVDTRGYLSEDFKYGGYTPKAQYGQAFGALTDAAITSYTGNSGGQQIGGEIGGLFGPAGKFAGGILGDALLSGGNRRKTMNFNDQSRASVNNIIGMNAGSYFQNQFNLKHGGTMKYGDGGDIQIQGEGSLSPISNNPYGGEMLQINGPSHTEGGTDLVVNGQPIEAEREPIYDTTEGDKVIAGDLKVPAHIKKSAETFTGEKFPGGKFKSVIKSIGEVENKQNRIKNNSVEKADDYTSFRPLDRISLNTLKTNIGISDNKLKKLQIIKDGFADVQEILNEEEEGDKARIGRKFKKKAQDGTTVTQEVADDNVSKGIWQETSPGNYIKKGQPGKTWTISELVEEGTDPTQSSTQSIERLNSYKEQWDNGKVDKTQFPTYDSFVKGAEQWWKDNPDKSREKVTSVNEITPGTPDIYEDRTESIPGIPDEYFNVAKKDVEDSTDPKKKFPWIDALSQIPSLFKDTDAEDFDNRALFPEINALVDNRLEAVQSQKYQPRLRVPYDISRQDTRNDIISQSRAIERMQANNPQLQGISRAETFTALNKNRGEEFRQNQAFKDQVHTGNLQTLNDSQLKNLAIADTQYIRQAQAKSITKATRQAAFSSISDKISKHALENKTLRIWENMYDFRYDKAYNAHYQGPPANFDEWKAYNDSLGGREPSKESYEEWVRNKEGQVISKTSRKYSTRTEGYAGPLGKNGYLVKSYKKFK